ncbi:hypothetical protein FQN54_001373 [Arachnomyces sp. PD_36]|nr:hypothetical protein FQN54_001373 [Arachnomyces sp. PD_36]
MALVGGLEAPRGRVMGHAGAWAAPGEAEGRAKIKALEDAGAVLVNHPEKFGEGMKALLRNSAKRPITTSASALGMGQQRGLHTLRRYRPNIRSDRIASTQARTLYIKQDQAFDMLREKGVTTVDATEDGNDFKLSISIDRTALSPCISASPTANPTDSLARTRKFPFRYGKKEFDANSTQMKDVAHHLGLPKSANEQLAVLVQKLVDIFMSKEAFLLETQVTTSTAGELQVNGARFGFDDAAFKSSKRQEDVHNLRNKSEEVPEEVEAEKDGIVYVKLEGEGSIGTLVNGAGLAMNTVDALTIHGGHCANFLDTGGKATAETVESSFRIICADPRVKAIFVNIFGGLTRCDMIAEGIIMAFKSLGMKVPVVVRLRGTNEEIGQKMIAESGLSLHSYDGFEEAAKKVISLSRET